MRVSLFVTCLIDQFWPSAGVAAVDVLRKAGCEVAFDPRQTCCSQPAFNTGYRDDARAIAKKLIEEQEETSDAIVVPSGSCGAMFRHLPELFEDDDSWRRRATAIAGRTHELASFLVDVLGIDDLGARFEGRLTWHDACHGLRDLGLREQPRRLLSKVRGATLVEMPGAESCCGFGGTFSVKYPEISVSILDDKLAGLQGLGVDTIVSGDVSCLMQIGGRLAHTGSEVRTLHLAEVLAGSTSDER